MIELGQLALDLIINLLASVIFEGASYKAMPYFERRKIYRRVEDAVAEVVEPLLPFLTQEKIPEDRQRRLIETCVNELRPFTQNPERLFQGSLDGQKIFEELYANRELPEVVIEDDLKEIYTLLCPRIATLLCKIPEAVKDWENEAWSENYRRLDELTMQLRQLFTTVDELATAPTRQADEILLTVRRALAQKVRLQLDLTGLRADSPLTGKFDDYFVHPQIRETSKDNQKHLQLVETPDDSFLQFIQSYHQTIIVAPAGAGKSTWAKWLQRETLTPRWSGVNIRIELRRFSGETLPSLHDLIRETAGKHLAEDITAARIGYWLSAKQVIFILDGFDEIRPSERDTIYDWIVDLKSAGRGCPFILTSRLLTTNHLERLSTLGWQEWTIEPFDETRIVDYIQRWYKHTPLLLDDNRIVDAVELAKNWRDDPTVEPLTGNPLLLSTLLMVHHLDGSLPNGRSQLYKRYVEGMLGLWDDRRQVSATSIQLTLEQKRQIIRGFALKLFFEEQDQIDEPVALAWLQEFLQKVNILFLAPEILSMLRERSGLIIGPGVYSFAHKSIAEYLVAETVLQGDQRDEFGTRIDRFRLFEHRDDDRWNTVTFLWAGLAPVADVEAFIDECVDTNNWTLGYGIFYDQYDRIPIDTRRRLILHWITKERIPIKSRSKSGWIVSRPSSFSFDGPGPGIPTPSLRGIGIYPTFLKLIAKAVMDGTLVWSDQIHSKGEWKDHLWICFADHFKEVMMWKACLASPPPANESSVVWLSGAFERALFEAIDQDIKDIELVLMACKEARPQFQGLIPIIIISTILYLFLHKDLPPNQSTYNTISKLLKILSNSSSGQIVTEWLLGTRDWVLGREIEDSPVGDLFINFFNLMQRLIKQGYIEQNNTYEQVAKFVQELQDLRDSLGDST